MREAAKSSGLKIAHQHPGRLRVRADAFIGDGAIAERTRTGIARLGAVYSIRHDPRTGSLLVEYDPHHVDASTLVGRIAELSDLELAPNEAPPPRREPGAGVHALFRKLDAFAQELTNGRLDLGVLVPGGLAALSAYSFLRGDHKRIPRWDSLVYWGYSIFVQAHPKRSVPVSDPSLARGDH